MTSARLHRCLEPGLSILIATVDAQNIPSSCRAVAIVSDDGLQTVTAYLPVATSHEALHNIALTKRLAIAATHPVDHCATQLKGTSVEARLAREDEATRSPTCWRAPACRDVSPAISRTGRLSRSR
jgi:hypothetical protein